MTIEKPATLERDGEEIAKAVRRSLARLSKEILAAERISHYLTRDAEILAAEVREWADPEEHPLGEFEGGCLGTDFTERYAEHVEEALLALSRSVVEVAKEAAAFEVLCDRSRVLRAHGIHDAEPGLDR